MDSAITLIVIDMQAAYPAAQAPDLVAGVEEAAARAVKDGGHVVAVAYDGSGTLTVNLPVGTHTIWKEGDDGGTILYAYLKGAGLVKKGARFVLAGVNLGACVFKTATGLAWRLYEEDAICDAVVVDPSLCGDGGRWKVRFASATDQSSGRAIIPANGTDRSTLPRRRRTAVRPSKGRDSRKGR